MQKENAQTYQEFMAKNSQYAELTELLREEEGVKISTGKEDSSEVVE